MEALKELARQLGFDFSNEIELLREAADRKWTEEESEVDRPDSEKRRFDEASGSLDVDALFSGLCDR